MLLRQYQPSVTNPRTPAQMSQRTKMKLAAQVAGMLGNVGRTALLANGNRKTNRGIAIKNGVTSPEAMKYFTHNTVSDGE